MASAKIWTVEDYCRVKKLYEENGAVFNPALERGSPAALHVIAQHQHQATQGDARTFVDVLAGLSVPGDGPEAHRKAYIYLVVRCDKIGGDRKEALLKLRAMVCLRHELDVRKIGELPLPRFVELLKVAESQEMPAATGGGAGQDRADDERPKPAKSSKAVPAKERRIKWLAEAMMLRRENPAMSKAEIARRVGINPGQLSPSRCPEFHELEKMIQGEVPGGHLTSNPESRQSDVEAYTADSKSDRGLPISGSKHFREYCAKCDDPIRVTEDKIWTKPRCKDCA